MSIATLSKSKKRGRAKCRQAPIQDLRGRDHKHAGQVASDTLNIRARSSKKPGKSVPPLSPFPNATPPASNDGADHADLVRHNASIRPAKKARKAMVEVNSISRLPSESQSSADGQISRDSLDAAASAESSSSPPDGLTRDDNRINTASGDDGIFEKLKFLHRQRRACIIGHQRAKLPLLSLYRFAFGWQATLPEADRKRLKDAAAEAADLMIELAETAKSQDELEALVPNGPCRTMVGYTLAYVRSSEPIEQHKAQLEKEMIALAKQLPGWSFVESVKGYGAIGLASIVGECGDLSKFSGPAKLWKYLGLAPKSCYVKTEGGVAEVPRARRSISWMYADPMFKHDNPYTRLYRKRREYEAANHPEFDTGKVNAKGGKQLTKHCDNRARRYAEKRFLRDLWRAWQAAVNLRKAA